MLWVKIWCLLSLWCCCRAASSDVVADKSVNLFWKMGFCLKTGEGVVGHKSSTNLRVSSADFLNYTQIYFNFWKVTTFGKCSQLIFLYIIGYNNISLRHHPRTWGHDPNPKDWHLWQLICLRDCLLLLWSVEVWIFSEMFTIFELWAGS